MLQSFLVALIAGIGHIDERLFGMTMMERPLVICTLVGLVYGDVKTGLVLGAQIELLSMGVVGIGANAAPPDVILGGALSTALVLQSHTDPKLALALVMPIAAFAMATKYITYVPLNQYLSQKSLEAAGRGDTKTMERNQWIGLFNYFIFPFLIALVAMLIGAPVFKSLVKYVPEWLTGGFALAAGILPALGFALLMQLTFTKKFAPYLFLGFILVAFFKLTNIGVAMVGAVIAALILLSGNDSGNKAEGKVENNEI